MLINEKVDYIIMEQITNKSSSVLDGQRLIIKEAMLTQNNPIVYDYSMLSGLWCFVNY